MAELDGLINRLKTVSFRSKVTEKVLNTIHVMTDERIFTRGKAADNSNIGTYAKSYVKYGRKKEGWGPSRKTILQLTSQMVNDYKFLVLPNGNYGSGFTNSKNFDKSEWVENTYDKVIFDLTNAEDKKMGLLLEKELDKLLI